MNNQRQCVYSADNRSSKKRRQFDEQRVQELEGQVTGLMEYIERLESERSQSVGETRFDAASVCELTDEIKDLESEQGKINVRTSAQSVPLVERERLPDALEDLSHLFWALEVSESGETHFRGPSGNFCYSDARAPPLQPSDRQEVCDVRVVYMLMNQYQQPHVDLFMEHVNPFYHFLDNTGLLQMTVEADMPLPLQLLHASVISAGALFSSDAAACANSRTIAAFAESIALECCRKYPSVAVLRALSIMSWMNIGIGNDNMGYMFDHMAMSMVGHLGLHAVTLPELRQKKPIDDLTQSTRVEAFWPVFLHDRIITSLLGRNCALPWSRVNVPFIDTMYEGTSLSEDQFVFSLQCRLWYLHDQHMDQIYSFGFGRLDATGKHRLLVNARDALLGFRKRMMELTPVRSQDSTTVGKVLHLCYHMSVTLLHRPFLQFGNDRTTRHLALRTITTAAEASSKIIKMLMATSDASKLPYFVIHHILTAALSHLLNATCADSKIRQKSVNGLRTCLNALEALCETWPSTAVKSLYEIRRLAARWKVVSALPMHLSHPLESDNDDPLQTHFASGFEFDPASVALSDGPSLDQIDIADFLDIVQDKGDVYDRDPNDEDDLMLWLSNHC